jgi:hypothetical protein
MRKVLITLVVIGSLLLVPVVTTADAGQEHSPSRFQQPGPAQTDASEVPDSASGFLSTFRSMEGTTAYQRYSEFEIVRSQAIFEVQIGEFTPSERRRMELVVRTLRTFREGYAYQQNGSYDAAIESANETSELLSELREVDGGERYAVLGEIALERFYARNGQALQTRAEQQETTPRRIDTLRRAALAYQRAGDTDRYSTVLVRVDRVRQSYRSDAETLNASAASASSFLKGCTACSGGQEAALTYGASVFTRYQRAIAASQDASTALALAEKHGLTDRAEELSQLQEELTASRTSLAVASVIAFSAYAFVLGLIAAVIAWRLTHWRQDLEAAARGDSILMGEMLRG